VTEPRTFVYGQRLYTFRSYAVGDHFDRWYAKHGGFYEPKLLETIRDRHLAGTYIDVGSNIGNHTVYFATQCRPEHIHAVEPHEGLRQVFAANVKANGCKVPITVHDCAIAAADGRVTMSPSRRRTPA